MIGVFAKLVAVCSCCCLSAVDVSAIWMMVAGFAVCDRGVVEFNNDSAVSSVMMTSSVIGSLPLESLFSSVLVFLILVCITFGFLLVCWFLLGGVCAVASSLSVSIDAATSYKFAVIEVFVGESLFCWFC